MPALKPYWGKPAVRNFRGDDGNGGIIRSPQRAIVLPDSGGRGVTCVPTGIKSYNSGADAVLLAEGNTYGRDSASAHMPRRGRRTWHV